MVTMVYLQATVVCLCLSQVWAVKDYVARDLLKVLDLSDNSIQEAFDGLNVNKDKILDIKDLQIFYHHKDTGFAKEKFMELMDTEVKDGKITIEELAAFIFQQHVTNAIWECTYVHSKSLRQYCFADQVLTYVLLVIDNDAIAATYAELLKRAKSDKVLKTEELSHLADDIPRFTEAEQRNFMVEIGGDDGVITYEEFRDYMSQEDLQDDFRRCRQKMSGIKGVYDNLCLIRELANFTMMDFTDLEIATLFKFYDEDNDKLLYAGGLTEAKVCDAETAEKFIVVMDQNGDDAVTYGEFRTYLKTHSVRMQMKRDCSEVHTSQHDEMDCYKAKVLDLVSQSHTPIWMKNVDLDITILFEELDTTDDGIINVQDDLIKGRSWDNKLANKMVNEVDGGDKDSNVNLKEFMEYMAYPNMVYAMNDCLFIKKRSDRTKCYERELKDTILPMLEKLQVKAFFKYLNTDGDKVITRKEVEAKGIKGDDADNFLVEMGMGDMTINYLEFFWFVRQQRISHMFERAPQTKAPQDLLPLLVKYIDEVMTEHDTQELFKLLDKDGDYELELSDFNGKREDVIRLLAGMDAIGEDQDNTANFYEFWLYLNSPFDTPRKTQLEDKCTKEFKKQADELACYVRTIVTVK